jgi:hypothetical protein
MRMGAKPPRYGRLSMPGAVALEGHAVLELIERVASEPLAAIFVGAGISTEAGLPSWVSSSHDSSSA